MGLGRAHYLAVFFIVLVAMETMVVMSKAGNSDDKNSAGNSDDKKSGDDKKSAGNDDDKNNAGNSDNETSGGNDNNNKGSGESSGENSAEGSNDKKSADDDALTCDYQLLTPKDGTGQERAFCKGKGACYYKTLTCPAECTERKPKQKNKKGCFINCGSKCEATCKYRKPNCDGYGSVCYDPRFVGGDGTVFYFHGSKEGNFAIVSDENLHINAHFIGSRPAGRTRDYTWVQALSIMFEKHTLDLAANKVSKWDDKVDSLIVRWDGETKLIPTDGEAEWKTIGGDRKVVVERTDYANSVRVTVDGLLELDVKVTPIGEKENKVHNYQLPENDAFAHLETQFRFKSLTDQVEGVLGKTYRPGYVSPAKTGVAMPILGGEDKYYTTSLHSTICKVCKFKRPSGFETTAQKSQY